MNTQAPQDAIVCSEPNCERPVVRSAAFCRAHLAGSMRRDRVHIQRRVASETTGRCRGTASSLSGGLGLFALIQRERSARHGPRCDVPPRLRGCGQTLRR